ncbi:hypothetical protein INT43_008439 [Umbelopsis isabellina]|uniref:TPX2 C-terminal domain-containing protein n=1 Tax=Mortierella isabellina TaxID=91625 RepID=A0A8H7UFA0_MORIS|nr:hypothetical protein INT43_008439 [Umbelopsis isabellina]
MRSSLGNCPSSIDLSFEEGFSFLGNEANEQAERPKPAESHWLFDKDDSRDVFLPNSPSRTQVKRPLALNTPSYAQQTFTSSIASLGKPDRDCSPLALEKSSTYVSPMRRNTLKPMINSHNAHTYTSPLTKKRKRSLASSPFEATSRTNALEEITENALEAEEAFVPLSERLRRYEESVEGSPVKSASEIRNSQSPRSIRSTPKRLSTISPAKTGNSPRPFIDDTIKAISPASPQHIQPTTKVWDKDQRTASDHIYIQANDIYQQLPNFSPLKTSETPRHTIGYMDKSLLNEAEIKPKDHVCVSPCTTREIDGLKPYAKEQKANNGLKPYVEEQNANENIPDDNDAKSTTTFRKLRVIDDVPPAPEPQPRRRTIPERPRSQPQPLSRTVPEPFTFATDVRHEQHQRQFQEKLKQWKERETIGHMHMASVPVPNFSRPFQVKRSTKPLTKTEDFVFHSEIRSLERKMAEDERKLQQNLEKTIKRRKTDHRERDYDIHSQRSTLIHSPTSSHRSRRTLTTPRSPKFSLLRSERRALRNDPSGIRNDASVIEHNDIRRWSESVSGALED